MSMLVYRLERFVSPMQRMRRASSPVWARAKIDPDLWNEHGDYKG
jgi:hypothetical protein